MIDTYGATAPYGELSYKGETPPTPFTGDIARFLIEQYKSGYTNSGGSYSLLPVFLAPKTLRIVEDLGSITDLLVTQYKTNYIN